MMIKLMKLAEMKIKKNNNKTVKRKMKILKKRKVLKKKQKRLYMIL